MIFDKCSSFLYGYSDFYWYSYVILICNIYCLIWFDLQIVNLIIWIGIFNLTVSILTELSISADFQTDLQTVGLRNVKI